MIGTLPCHTLPIWLAYHYFCPAYYWETNWFYSDEKGMVSLPGMQELKLDS